MWSYRSARSEAEAGHVGARAPPPLSSRSNFFYKKLSSPAKLLSLLNTCMTRMNSVNSKGRAGAACAKANTRLATSLPLAGARRPLPKGTGRRQTQR